MGLTPPAHSPASPPNEHYSPETTCLEYLTPDTHGKQYNNKSSSVVCGLVAATSAAARFNPETTLPPLETMASSGWSTDYDPFAPFDTSISVDGPDGICGHQGPPGSHEARALHRSRPQIPSTSRACLPSDLGTSNPTAPRLKVETAPEYAPGAEIPHYPSPASMHARYPAESNGYLPPSGCGYVSDGQSRPWSRSGFPPVETEHFFLGISDMPGSLVQDARQSDPAPRLRRPARRMTTKEEANFQCEVRGCGKLFSRSYNFKAHMETHDEGREYPFPCPLGDCNRKFVRKTDLQRHHQSVHMKERNHKCDYCGRLFARKDTLRRHMEDGCSKRFDIGTLDLRAGGYDNLDAGTRPLSSLSLPQGSLPPLTAPPMSDNRLLAPGGILRDRSSGHGCDQTRGQEWER